MESNEWRERAAKSYYKNNNNYVFLSKFGTPFYTSQQEKIDRANRVYQSDKVLVEKFGESVRKYLNDILKLMAQDNQPIRKFSIHDLRATFGLNLLNNLKDCNLSENEIMDEIRERMGHEKFKTTLNYLTYSARNEAYKRVSEKFSEVIYKFE